jgi:hypothetical protein
MTELSKEKKHLSCFQCGMKKEEIIAGGEEGLKKF